MYVYKFLQIYVSMCHQNEKGILKMSSSEPKITMLLLLLQQRDKGGDNDNDHFYTTDLTVR